MGVYLHLESTFEDIGFDVGSPAIYVIVVGAILAVIGLLGCVGALFELYYVLIAVSGRHRCMERAAIIPSLSLSLLPAVLCGNVSSSCTGIGRWYLRLLAE